MAHRKSDLTQNVMVAAAYLKWNLRSLFSLSQFLSFLSYLLPLFLFYSFIVPSQRGQESGSYGPQRSVRPLREA